MASPRPQPTALKIAKGNPSKKALNHDEPKPSLQLPSCPDYLVGAAKDCWEVVLPELSRIGILTVIDIPLFIRYCAQWADWKGCHDFLVKNGHDHNAIDEKTGEVVDGKGCPRAQSRRKREIEVLLLRYEQEMGMTPSARSKLHATVDQGDALDKFLTPEK